jgi:hypothetical protein
VAPDVPIFRNLFRWALVSAHLALKPSPHLRDLKLCRRNECLSQEIANADLWIERFRLKLPDQGELRLHGFSLSPPVTQNVTQELPTMSECDLTR